MPLKWPETNYQSCSVELSLRLLEEFGLQWRFSTIYDLGLQTYRVHRQDNANDTKSKFDSYLYWQVPNTYPWE